MEFFFLVCGLVRFKIEFNVGAACKFIECTVYPCEYYGFDGYIGNVHNITFLLYLEF